MAAENTEKNYCSVMADGSVCFNGIKFASRSHEFCSIPANNGFSNIFFQRLQVRMALILRYRRVLHGQALCRPLRLFTMIEHLAQSLIEETETLDNMQASILPIVWSFSSKSAPNGSSPDLLLKRNCLNLNLTCSKILVFRSETSWKDRRLKISIFSKGMFGHFKIKVSKKLLDRSMQLFHCSNGSKLSFFHVLSWDFSVPKSLQNTELVIDCGLFFS